MSSAAADDLAVAALRDLSNQRTCYICTKPDHMHVNCPQIEALRANQRIARLVCRMITSPTAATLQRSGSDAVRQLADASHPL